AAALTLSWRQATASRSAAEGSLPHSVARPVATDSRLERRSLTRCLALPRKSPDSRVTDRARRFAPQLLLGQLVPRAVTLGNDRQRDNLTIESAVSCIGIGRRRAPVDDLDSRTHRSIRGLRLLVASPELSLEAQQPRIPTRDTAGERFDLVDWSAV